MKRPTESNIAEKIAKTLQGKIEFVEMYNKWSCLIPGYHNTRNQHARLLIHNELKRHYLDGYNMVQFNHIEKFLKFLLNDKRI